VYLMSLIDGAHGAQRFLTDGPFRDRPRFERLEPFVTLAIPVRRTRTRPPPDVAIERATADHLAELAACICRNGRRHQFAPCWTISDLQSTARARGLSVGDFFVALRRGRVVGCVARWDQRAFKQVVVRGYAPRLARWRPLVNVLGLAAPWLAMPRLPPAGTMLDVAYLSHLSVDGDDPDVARALVSKVLAARETQAFSYVTVSVAERHPFCRALAGAFAHRRYAAQLWTACWPDGEDVVRELDGRVSYPEGALL
jgi:hypothetical protein